MSLHVGLADQHRLEAPLQRRVLLDVLAVLVERGRADRAQLAAGQHRLQQVGGVDRAFGGAGADDRVQLVEEEDDLARAPPGPRSAPPSAAPRTRRGTWSRPAASRCRARSRGGRAGSRARRRRRSAGPAPRRSRSCRRRGRRSAPGCSWSGGRAPGSRGGSPRRGRSPGRACRSRRRRSGRGRISPAPGRWSSGLGR